MREALTGRKAQRVGTDTAAEQYTKDIDRPPRRRERFVHAAETGLVPGNELTEARVQSMERLVVRGQHQYVIGYALTEGAERPEPLAQWIGIGLRREHGDVRGDTGQHLVARDEYREVRRVEAEVLW